MNNTFICLLSLFLIASTLAQLPKTVYKRLSYQDILEKFTQLEEASKGLLRLQYPTLSSPKLDQQCGNEKCKYFYAEVSQFYNYTEEEINTRPQIIFSGGLQGNNFLGPNIVTYLTEYLLENNATKKISSLLQDRIFILYPIPNPFGFYSQSNNIDISSLFPNIRTLDSQLDIQCEKNYAASIFQQIFSSHLIITGAIFELDGSAVEYPLLKSSEGVEQDINKQISIHLSKNAPSNFNIQATEYSIQQINFDQTSSRFFSYFSYASFQKYINKQSPFEQQKNSQSSCGLVNNHTHSSILFRIRCSKLDPPQSHYGEKQQSINPYSNNIGHIQRNILLSLELAEMVATKIVTNIKIFDQNRVFIEWQAVGCFQVDYTAIYYFERNVTNIEETISKNITIQEIQEKYLIGKEFWNQTGSMINNDHKLFHTFEFKNETLFDAIILATCDQHWAGSALENYQLLTGMRTIDNFQASNGNYSVSSRKQAISHLSNIQSITNKTSEKEMIINQRKQVHKDTLQFWIYILISLGGITIIGFLIFLASKCLEKYRQFEKDQLIRPSIIKSDKNQGEFEEIEQKDVEYENFSKSNDFNKFFESSDSDRNIEMRSNQLREKSKK